MTKNSKFNKFFSILSFAVCFALCIQVSSLLSSFITITAATATVTDNCCQNAFDIYAINLYETDAITSANEQREIFQKKNCAGYIYKENQTYYILASAYANQTDAENVCKKLQETQTQCSVKKIHYSELKINSNTNSQEKKALQNALSIFYSTYKQLYDLSVSIDVNLYSASQSKVEIAKILSDLTLTQTTFESMFKTKLTSSLLNLKLSLQNANTLITNLSTKQESSIPYSASVKHCYFEILNIHQTLSTQIINN